MKRIYIIGETKHEEQREFLAKISEKFVENEYAIYMPHQHVKDEAELDAKRYYATHMRFLKSSCMVVADVSFPSLKLGIELEKANSLRIPIAIMFKKNSRVEELLKGMPMVKYVIQYDTESALVESFNMYIKEFER